MKLLAIGRELLHERWLMGNSDHWIKVGEVDIEKCITLVLGIGHERPQRHANSCLPQA